MKKFIALIIAAFVLGASICYMVMSMISAQNDRVAIVTDKYEVGGACFVKVVIPVDTDTYIGLDVGDECTFEE